MGVRDEYQSLIAAFTGDVKKELATEVSSLILYGSVAANEHIAGESDCDFLLILKDEAVKGKKLTTTLAKIGTVIGKYLEDPLYASLIDIDILEEKQIPKGDNSIYPWTKVHLASKGKALIGKNPFEGIKVKDEHIKETARQMAREYYQQLKDLFVFPPEDEYQQTFITIDAVLGLACAHLFFLGERDLYKSTAFMIYEEKHQKNYDIEPVVQSHRMRLASKNAETKDFTQKALAFADTVINEIFK